MPSAFLLQIVDRDSGKVIQADPGGPLEVELIAELGKRLQAMPVGILATRSQVSKAVVAAFTDIIHDLKVRV